jgi:pyruvate ferredoxin oxidoreductase beta subunit
MEATTFQNVGRATDNGVKTIYTIGTSCAEVSTLAFPNVVAWGRGDGPPDSIGKTFSIIHNVFESAPSVAEGARDVADSLTEHGAINFPVQVISNSGDGGAIAIGLRALLHTINRKTRITIMVLVNEIFANTGFQYSPAAMPMADTSTTPSGSASQGNPAPPIDYVHLCIAAGAGMVAQVSPAHGGLFLRTMERAIKCEETAVVFVPAPCISGWKFNDGEAVALALLGAKTGAFPAFIWEKGKGGSVKDCSLDPAKRPPLEEFLGGQRRFNHLVKKENGSFVPRPGREDDIAKLRDWVQGNVERLYKLSELK